MIILRNLDPQSRSRLELFFKKHTILTLIGIFFIGFLLYWLGSSSSSAFNFVFRGTSLQTEDGRINVLLLGISGGRHEGATLADTIMVGSYDVKNHKVDLISIPRDLWIEKQKAKINTLYQMGLLRGNGLKFAESEIGEMLGMSIPYGVRVDFSGFVKAIDLVGGVDVEVVSGFDDYEYPIEGKEEDLCGNKESEIEIDRDRSRELNIPEGKQKVYITLDGKTATSAADLDLKCRFEHINFKKGQMHMNGDTALKFARSRHGNNQEGSDFARSKRQQVILEAFRNKVLSVETLTDLAKIVSLVKTFGDNVETDIPQSKYLELGALVKRTGDVRSHVIGFGGANSLLIHPDPVDYGGAWVLIPPGNDFTKIRRFIDDVAAGKVAASESGRLQ